jgi:hypothetical protein
LIFQDKGVEGVEVAVLCVLDQGGFIHWMFWGRG